MRKTPGLIRFVRHWLAFALVFWIAPSWAEAGCPIDLESSLALFDAGGGEGTISFATEEECYWQASVVADWLQFEGGAAGEGSASINFRVEASSEADHRWSVVRIDDAIFTVVQSGVVPVDFQISNPQPIIGEEILLTVNDAALKPILWRMGSPSCEGEDPVIHCSDDAEGECRALSWTYPGPGLYELMLVTTLGSRQKVVWVQDSGGCSTSCAAASPPVAQIELSANPVTVGQPLRIAAKSSTALPAPPLSTDMSIWFDWEPEWPEMGELVDFEIHGPESVDSVMWDFGGAGCRGYPQQYSCTPLYTDCMTMSHRYAETGVFKISVEVHEVHSYPSVTLNRSIQVMPRGACPGEENCTVSIWPRTAVFPALGGQGSVMIAAGEHCAWEAQLAASWIELDSEAYGAGATRISYSIEPNTGEARSTTFRVGDETLEISQQAAFTGEGSAATDWHWQLRREGVVLREVDLEAFAHVFSEPGQYKVQLKAANCRGFDTAVQDLMVDENVVDSAQGLVAPAVVRAPGLNQTMWRSDLTLFNPNDESVMATLQFLPRDRDNVAQSIPRATLELAPNESKRLEDVVSFILPGDESALSGTLGLSFETLSGTAPSLKPVAAVRVYNDTGEGTFGQYIPVWSSDERSMTGSWLTGLREDDDFRTNVGLVNLGPEPATVDLTLLDANGMALGELSRSVPGLSSTMVVKAAREAGLHEAIDEFSLYVTNSTGPVHAYASMIDNRTGDPVFYDSYSTGNLSVLVPGVAQLPGVNESQWETDMALGNPLWFAQAARLEYRPSESTIGEASLELSTLEPGAAMAIRGVVPALYADQIQSKGVLSVQGVEGSLAPHVAARTFTTDEDGGSYGQALAVFGNAELIHSGELAVIPGVLHSPDATEGFRTNLGLVNADEGADAVCTLRILDVEGRTLATIEQLELAPLQMLQFNLFSQAGIAHMDVVGTVVVHLQDGGPVIAYASIVDNRTQDPILVPAQPLRTSPGLR